MTASQDALRQQMANQPVPGWQHTNTGNLMSSGTNQGLFPNQPLASTFNPFGTATALGY